MKRSGQCCERCNDLAARYRAIKVGLDPEWLCDDCVQVLLDQLAGWMVEHDRLADKGMPERDIEKHIASLISRGARPPHVGRA